MAAQRGRHMLLQAVQSSACNNAVYKHLPGEAEGCRSALVLWTIAFSCCELLLSQLADFHSLWCAATAAPSASFMCPAIAAPLMLLKLPAWPCGRSLGMPCDTLAVQDQQRCARAGGCRCWERPCQHATGARHTFQRLPCAPQQHPALRAWPSHAGAQAPDACAAACARSTIAFGASAAAATWQHPHYGPRDESREALVFGAFNALGVLVTSSKATFMSLRVHPSRAVPSCTHPPWQAH